MILSYLDTNVLDDNIDKYYPVDMLWFSSDTEYN